jgi:biopolymer transport protein ExbD
VDAGPGMVPDVYVNSKATTWSNLASDLKDQLKLRPEWVVYVEANRNVAWAYAVNVVDVAKGLHARVVLMTSQPATHVQKPSSANK